MTRFIFVALVAAVSPLFWESGCALAGTPSKGLKVDPILQQAIIESAEPEKEPLAEEEVEVVPAEPPVFEEEMAEPAPELPPPAVAAIETPARAPISWPEEPGRRWGGLLFLPSLLVKAGLNDNLFASDTLKETDFVTHFTPRLRMEIPDIRHEVALEGEWEYRTHLEHNDENQHNLSARFGGALNAEKGFSVPFDFSWASTHEEREDDLAGQLPASPLERDDFKASGGLRVKGGSVGLALLGHYNKQRFEDGEAMVTRAPVIRRDADRDITELELNTSFDLDPENTLMLWGTYGGRDYERQNYQAGGFTGPRRDSDTFSGMLSWLFKNPTLEGHLSLGVSDYNYESAAIDDVREFVGDIEVEHRIGSLTTVNLQLARSIDEDAEIVDPLIRSRFGFYVDHQPWEDTLLAAGADYNFIEFANSGRDDETWDFRVIADYFLNDFLAFGAEYVYTLRDSEAAGLDFNRNMILLRARGRL